MTQVQAYIKRITQDIPARFLKPEVEYSIRGSVIKSIIDWSNRNELINPEEELDLYIKTKEEYDKSNVRESRISF